MAVGPGVISAFCPPSHPFIRGKWEIIVQIYLNMVASNFVAISTVNGAQDTVKGFIGRAAHFEASLSLAAEGKRAEIEHFLLQKAKKSSTDTL